MNGVPPFSIFSALSEVFVTIAVLVAVCRSLKGQPLMIKTLGATLSFELCVNVLYMAGMSGTVEKSVHPTWFKIFAASHGILSLGMFVGLAILFMLAVWDVKDGRKAWFERHPVGTWIFIGLWMISVSSGEFLFIYQYGGKLLGAE